MASARATRYVITREISPIYGPGFGFQYFGINDRSSFKSDNTYDSIKQVLKAIRYQKQAYFRGPDDPIYFDDKIVGY